MQIIIVLAIATSSGLLGIALGWFLRFIISLGKRGSMELEIKEMLLSAREESEKITSGAEKKAQQMLEESKQEIKKENEELQKTKDRLVNKEDLLDRRQIDLDSEEEDLKNKNLEIENLEQTLSEEIEKKSIALEGVSRLTKEEAKEILIKEIEKKYEEDLMVRLQKLENQNQEKLSNKAKEIIATCIQRFSISVPTELFSSVVDLPNDEVKGKIIGKEGRNIKAFERETGVDLIIDDTPSVITISSYDPIRREIAKKALEELIKDGRIQPAKIEQVVEKTKKELQKNIKDHGEKAAYECGIFDLDPKILGILGRLHYRTSYGQNVLQHSIEMAHISAMIAEELGANVKTAKAGALLHDIGKAVDHEIPGSHTEIGKRILQKFNVDPEIIKAMQSHHEEHEFMNLESIIVYVADSISGGRPGARSDNAENYLKRLADLEAIANEFEHIDKSYALQAGREIRIFVKPDEISDYESHKLAADVAQKIENELKYPGEIKVTVIRENRIIEYAR